MIIQEVGNINNFNQNHLIQVIFYSLNKKTTLRKKQKKHKDKNHMIAKKKKLKRRIKTVKRDK